MPDIYGMVLISRERAYRRDRARPLWRRILRPSRRLHHRPQWAINYVDEQDYVHDGA